MYILACIRAIKCTVPNQSIPQSTRIFDLVYQFTLVHCFTFVVVTHVSRFLVGPSVGKPSGVVRTLPSLNFFSCLGLQCALGKAHCDLAVCTAHTCLNFSQAHQKVSCDIYQLLNPQLVLWAPVPFAQKAVCQVLHLQGHANICHLYHLYTIHRHACVSTFCLYE
jgi:hypothetical protein